MKNAEQAAAVDRAGLSGFYGPAREPRRFVRRPGH